MKKSDAELTVDPVDFTLLIEHSVLAVRCEPYRLAGGFVYEFPPADLTALVGKACETCGGRGYTADAESCGDCLGTGSELLTVTTTCEGPEPHGAVDPCGNRLCEVDGTRSLLVRLTGQPVPVVDGRGPEWDVERQGSCVMVFDPPYEQAPGVTWVTAHYVAWGEYRAINLGPNSASLIGRWAWLPDALEVLR